MKVRPRIHNNEFCRSYHCDKELIQSREYYSYGSLVSDPEEAFQMLSSGTKQLVTDTVKISGITSISVHDKYEMQIVIGEAFDWADIEPQIKAAFEKFAGDETVQYLDTKVDPKQSYSDY